MLVRRAVVCLVLLIATAPRVDNQATPAPHARATETALDRYVAAPDSHFSFSVAGELPAVGATAMLLDMTSQQWLTKKEVQQPLWRHWLTVIRPATVTSDIALLFIGGSANDKPRPAKPPQWLVDIARETGTVVAELRMVPNQPVVFQDDPEKKPRVEDDFIAYTWDKFLTTGDDRWPARLPMTKSAVRAMDAITMFMASPAGRHVKVARFVVAGASKRGWTTWTTAAVDTRVVAIAPAVIDLLNLEPSFVHHWRAYGEWSSAVHDYSDRGIMDWIGTPQFRALLRLVEPFEYRARLTMPKMLINASGDEFFLPDSSRFYLDALPGETHVRYVANTGHGLDKTDATQTLHAFYAAIARGAPRPSFTWTFEDDGAIRVVSKDLPRAVTLWQATNARARDFRIDVLGPAYAASVLTPVGPNTWLARLSPPTQGWTAAFVELTFDTGGRVPLKLTTAVRVLPDTLPFPAPVSKRHVPVNAPHP